MSITNQSHWKISIDTGGTFTDCLATDPFGQTKRIKVLSSARLRGRLLQKIAPLTYRFEAAWKLTDDLLTGYFFKSNQQPEIAQVVSLNHNDGIILLNFEIPQNEPTDFELFTGEEAPILAARLITETPLNTSLPKIEMRLGTTKGTNALLERKGAKTILFVTKGFKDLLYIGTQQRPSLFQLDIPEPDLLYSKVLELEERLDYEGNILKELTLDNTFVPDIEEFESVAISLLHAHKNDIHEKLTESWISQSGKNYISTSSKLYPFSHYLRRTQTTLINAYLEPVLDQYFSRILASLGDGNLKIMTSSGSLTNPAVFQPKDSLLSGPAGGMIAAARIAQRFGYDKVLTFDMGGTSTDTARIDDGLPELKYITQIDGIEFHNPSLAIETVAAGGGSVCWFDGYTLQVGSHSAGASPGPACYGAGGPLTITDVNFLLGKMDTSRFGIPINGSKAWEALQKLSEEIAEKTGNRISDRMILEGFEKIANEKMAEAIRKISVARGIDPAEYALVTFGGAGGLHCCQIAELLDTRTVVIPYDAGLFSAVGISESLVSVIVSRQILQPYQEVVDDIPEILQNIEKEATAKLFEQNITEQEIAFTSLFLRFKGQENAIEVPYSGDETIPKFKAIYLSQFGYYPENSIVELESIRMMVQEKTLLTVPIQKSAGKQKAIAETHIVNSNIPADTAVYDWDIMTEGQTISGPSILLNNTSTTYIPKGWELIIQENKDAIANRTEVKKFAKDEDSEAIALQLFTNRFESITEDMGAQLQRTAFSVNVKERLDFSCALLDPDGELLVNAQHIPVHLGSMGICTRLVKAYISIEPGDVIITNHPKYGGSHLPDITLIAGVFTSDNQLAGYVINRAHHAEVGGKTPGSMPPDATTLAEEGVVILPQYLVKKGVFQREAIRELFLSGTYPTRSFASNEADLMAALSALRNGSEQLLKLVDNHGFEIVRKYMKLLKSNASYQLKEALIPYHNQIFEATESLDDGHTISVKITISETEQIFDFTGTSAVHPNNLNANISILYSAILYVLRLLVNKKVPLNDGLMERVKIVLPDNSFLHPVFSDDPEKCPAVVGGNTEVSQRLVDTLLKALGLAACSQGTMNNFLFGDEQFGYYETIGGGTGAGAGFHGRSAVHQHMTNTRITDPEPMEQKYPVRLLEFGIRKNSGGAGQFKGGDGIIRKVEFLKPLQITLLTQHRVSSPYGVNGGKEGKTGRHIYTLADGATKELPGIFSFRAGKGDILQIETPGGGGYENSN